MQATRLSNTIPNESGDVIELDAKTTLKRGKDKDTRYLSIEDDYKT